MPTYGYRCSNCKNEFEIIQKMSDAPLTECEKCGGALKKILYPVGIAFKGEGFYVNDSAKSSGGRKSDKHESSESSESAPASGDAAKTETKSDAKTETPAAPAAAAKSDAAA